MKHNGCISYWRIFYKAEETKITSFTFHGLKNPVLKFNTRIKRRIYRGDKIHFYQASEYSMIFIITPFSWWHSTFWYLILPYGNAVCISVHSGNWTQRYFNVFIYFNAHNFAAMLNYFIYFFTLDWAFFRGSFKRR